MLHLVDVNAIALIVNWQSGAVCCIFRVVGERRYSLKIFIIVGANGVHYLFSLTLFHLFILIDGYCS